MPPRSKAQHEMMREDLRRIEAGEKPRTGMTKAQLEEYVSGADVKDLPERVKPKSTAKKRR